MNYIYIYIKLTYNMFFILKNIYENKFLFYDIFYETIKKHSAI